MQLKVKQPGKAVLGMLSMDTNHAGQGCSRLRTNSKSKLVGVLSFGYFSLDKQRKVTTILWN